MDFSHPRDPGGEKTGSYAKGHEESPNDMNSQLRFEDYEENYIKVSTTDIPCVDPLAVNKLLTQELNQMTLDRREHISEEIHGVKSGGAVSLQCATSSNSPLTQQKKEELVLREFQEELDRYYFSETSRIGTNSFAIGSRSSLNYTAYRFARDNGSELIKDRDFQLTFFGRGTDGSCPKKAAKRMLNYLEFVRQIYNTDDVLFRPIALSDLNEAIGAKKFMYEVAPFQILPLRDPSGRRVVVHLRDFGPSSCPILVRQQVGMYFAQSMSEDQDGIVFVSFLHHIHHNLYNAQEFRDLQRMIETIPPKFSAVHLCFPEGRLYDIAKAAVMLLIGKENRERLRLHVGSYQECKYALRSFGIPVDRLPVDLESKSKHAKKRAFDLKYHRKWLSMREAKETVMFAAVGRDNRGKAIRTDINGIGSSYKGVMVVVREIRSKFVECPRHEDCLFGKGRPAMYHPGNIAMRRLLDAKIKRFENMMPLQKSIVVWEVVNQIKRGTGRFLKEDTDHAGVFVITDDDTAFKKIAIAFRDLKKRRIRGGEQKEIGGQSIQRSFFQEKGKKHEESTSVRGRKRPAKSEAQLSGTTPEDRSGSAATDLGVSVNMDMGDGEQCCLFPAAQGNGDPVLKQRKQMRSHGSESNFF